MLLYQHFNGLDASAPAWATVPLIPKLPIITSTFKPPTALPRVATAPPALPAEAPRMPSGLPTENVAPTEATPPVALTPAYPPGSLFRFNIKKGNYSIYVLSEFAEQYRVSSGLGCLCPLSGDAAPTGMTKVAESAAPPTDINIHDGGVEGNPWYSNWKLWAGIGGGLVVVGAAVYFVRRRGA
jgi:hypothetical protein